MSWKQALVFLVTVVALTLAGCCCCHHHRHCW